VVPGVVPPPHGGTLGDVSTPSPDRRPEDADRPRPPVDDTPLIPGRSADDSDAGWGDDRGDSNDDRLLRDVPPHW
jgi:hypothetical protein